MPRIVKDPEVRYQEIVNAARELFHSKTYDKTTMRDIMDELSIAKGTIYHYFNSKEDLLDAVIEQSVEEYVNGVQAVLDATEGNAVERLRVLITYSNVGEAQSAELESLHQAGNVRMHTRQLAVTITKLAPIYASVVQQGCDEGIFHTQHPLECSEILLTGTQFLTDMGMYAWQPADLMRRFQAFPALVEAQLGAPQGSFGFLLEQD